MITKCIRHKIQTSTYTNTYRTYIVTKERIKHFVILKKNRCPKSQQVQSVECSNVGKYTCSSHYREDTTRREAGLLWLNEAAPSLRSNIPQTAFVATLVTPPGKNNNKYH
jgi:hypothetical protein